MRLRGRTLFAIGLTVFVALPAASAAYLVQRMPQPHAAAARITEAAAGPSLPLDNQHHLYVLDGHGAVHPVGDAPALATSITWPNKDVAYSLALFPDGKGGYVLNAWGGLDAVGDAPAIQSNAGLTEFGIARAIVMAPWSSRAEPGGYLLDGYGNIHPFGGAPPVSGNAVWGVDIARAIVLLPLSTRQWAMGYTLDGFGGIHAFGGARPLAGFWYRPGSDVVRGLVLEPPHGSRAPSGYSLDVFGGVHPFGDAPAVATSASWPGRDMADSIVAWTGASVASPGGWVLDRHGGVHQYGSAPVLAAPALWPAYDIARGLGSSGGSGGGSHERDILDPELLSDAWGAYYNQRDARWGSQAVGVTVAKVWKIGCLITDLAMVYTHFGFRDVTPATIAAQSQWFGFDGQIVNAAFSVPGHPAVIKRNPGMGWISAQLAAGHPVIVGMNLPGGGTHFVTLTGLNGASDFWTNDPWDQNAIHVPFSGDWDDRGQVYEAIAFY